MSTKPEKLKVKQKSVPEKKSPVGKIIVIVVAVLAAALIGLMIFMNTSAFYRTVTALTVADQDFSAADFNYYYNLTFNNLYNSMKDTYGESFMSSYVDTTKSLKTQQFTTDQTWHEYIRDTAVSSIQNVVMLYDESQKAGFTLTDEQQATLNERLADPKTQADSYGVSVDDFLLNVYGRGVNMDVFTRNLTMTYIASCYSTSIQDGIELTEADYEAKYAEDPSAYDQVTFRAFSVPVGTTTDEADNEQLKADAKATADAFDEALASAEDKEQSFIDLALQYAAESDKSKYEDPDYTLNQYWRKSDVNADYADWLFDSTRAMGDTTVIETDSSAYVLMFVSRTDPKYDTVNVRHILVKVNEDDNGETTDKMWELCKQSAEDILSQWQAGDATEDSFATLANEKSEDTGSNTTGGLYENVYKGQMLKNFNDWCFDAARQTGDTGIVKTSYGYHVLYFSGVGENYFTSQLDSTLRSAAYASWEDEHLPNYTTSTHSFGLRYVG